MSHTERILAIETSGRCGSVATLWGDANEASLIGQAVLTGSQRTAQSLAPAIQQLLASANWSPNYVDLVAVAVGPGSFTGLRIGVTTAKAFAYAVDAELVGVNTLTALAAQTPPSASPLWTVLDAQRRELFAAKFRVAQRLDIRVERSTAIVPQERWLASLTAGDRVVGPALKRLLALLPGGVVALPEELWQPMATAVGQVAWKVYQAGQRDDVWKLAPNYYRPSAAEEKRLG
ncbi:MAG TPA: tRNA (adenosine(37)-N6)-threonylcarbamoyltransferase complex dimerization subunit type 1 TsaB [Lacipirellulaceae bacterium]|nr:tRNA (adenosine(37)-N6)-threonylcarbamoyltransferase complex dimerization subunit type 1 TsaB [Lacipirellulaceae bacterium]